MRGILCLIAVATLVVAMSSESMARGRGGCNMGGVATVAPPPQAAPADLVQLPAKNVVASVAVRRTEPVFVANAREITPVVNVSMEALAAANVRVTKPGIDGLSRQVASNR